jgi:NAD(P)-dependent dehydrogenase (short-subunit alcohol dehydrogenase family)
MALATLDEVDVRQNTKLNRMKDVLVTGASTGIGNATVSRLAKTARVFAGVRSEKDYAALGSAGPNVVPVYLDVTDPDSIAKAKAQVATATGGRLDGVVNNAGIVVAAPLEVIEPAEFRKQLDVNVVGPLLVTQAFLPLIHAAKGRIVTIGSISGKFATPFTGAYSISKFAVEALSDALRLELAPFGIKVILIEPGPVKTPIWQTTAAATQAAMGRIPAESLAPYAGSIAKMQAFAAQLEKDGVAPDVVAAVVERALTTKSPRARYLVGSSARAQLIIARLPEGLRDRLILMSLARAK